MQSKVETQAQDQAQKQQDNEKLSLEHSLQSSCPYPDSHHQSPLFLEEDQDVEDDDEDFELDDEDFALDDEDFEDDDDDFELDDDDFEDDDDDFELDDDDFEDDDDDFELEFDPEERGQQAIQLSLRLASQLMSHGVDLHDKEAVFSNVMEIRKQEMIEQGFPEDFVDELASSGFLVFDEGVSTDEIALMICHGLDSLPKYVDLKFMAIPGMLLRQNKTEQQPQRKPKQQPQRQNKRKSKRKSRKPGWR